MNPINISLLPSEYKRQKQLTRKINISTIAMFILVLVLAFTYLIIQILSTVPKAELTFLQNECTKHDAEISSLLEYNELAEQIQNTYVYTKKTAGNQPDWISLLVAISQTLPEGIQISEINTGTANDSNNAISVNGVSKDHETTALWVKELKLREEFTDVNIEFSYTTPISTTEFRINLITNKDMVIELFEEVE